MRHRRFAPAVLAWCLLPAAAAAQAGLGDTGTFGDPGSAGVTAPDQLRFRAGPFRFSPYVRVGNVAFDTNVFYTSENRQSDLTANGGPGLRIDAPIGRFDPYVDGALNYYWFARTDDLRRLAGHVGGGFEWLATAFRLAASAYQVRRYDRPSVEIDERVARDELILRTSLDFDAGAKLRLRPAFSFGRREPEPGQNYLGADISTSLRENRANASLEIGFSLTPKTSLVAFGDQEWGRFPDDPSRDLDSNRIAGGIALESRTRLSGRALGGVRLLRPKELSTRRSSTRPYVNLWLGWAGEKTRFEADFRLDTYLSAFDSLGAVLPYVDQRHANLRLNRLLGVRTDLDLSAGFVTLRNLTPVTIVDADGVAVVKRDDRYYWASLDLGVRIVSRLRLGGTISYNDRRSNYADFGVDGLLLGASLRFNP